jgi:hypothetical protein
MRVLSLALTVGLIMVSSAHAQNPVPADPTTTAAEVLTGVSPQSREEQIGETRIYVSETVQSGPGNVASRNRQTFALETMALTRNKILMRYRLTSAEAEDAARPYLAGLLQAYVDVPIEFEASLNGMPQRIINWTRVSQALDANMAQALPAEEALRTGTLAGLNAMPENVRALAILSDVATLAQMQPRGPVRLGRVTAPETRTPVADNRFIVSTRFAEMDMIEPARCTARFQSGSSAQVEGAQDRTTTTLVGELSTLDGWTNNLERRTEAVSAQGTAVQTLTIRREATPGCS